ncbi:Zn-dependent protease with chaperone function [Hymenobacter luteus]|uniref:Zn-dependent protease with chaperone function n=2 Tax=Hymenobacter TaxID=89966 RepID=A0A7W9W9S8_9BACT|nr:MULTISPECIES: hypothetical protein [Hymenobacter]MBB4599706.1 hypothetical protein [Hymenobacter latericoloratus]MBB6057984.1 Zn-dependent protease with chaperone function [Hymenobacter luteus]
MKKLVRGALLGAGLCWPLLAYAGEQEDKYVFLLVGGVGGMLVGVGLYGLLMVLVALFVRPRAVVWTAFALGGTFLVYMQYTSLQILGAAARLGQRLEQAPAAGTVAVLLKAGGVVMLLFGVLIFRVAFRLWQRREARRK